MATVKPPQNQLPSFYHLTSQENGPNATNGLFNRMASALSTLESANKSNAGLSRQVKSQLKMNDPVNRRHLSTLDPYSNATVQPNRHQSHSSISMHSHKAPDALNYS